jgi:hypothetical protein
MQWLRTDPDLVLTQSHTTLALSEPWEDSPEGWPQPFGSGRPMSQQFRLDGRPISQWSRPPPMPGWALPPDAVATLRRVQR